MSLKHDDVYAGAWECDYERPSFDPENDNATPSYLVENPAQAGLLSEKTWNTPGTARECSRDISL